MQNVIFVNFSQLQKMKRKIENDSIMAFVHTFSMAQNRKINNVEIEFLPPLFFFALADV